MKMQSTLIAALIAVFAGIPYAALAADEKAPAATNEAAQATQKAEAPVTATAPQEKAEAAPEPVITAQAADVARKQHDADMRRRHLHWRDGK